MMRARRAFLRFAAEGRQSSIGQGEGDDRACRRLQAGAGENAGLAMRKAERQHRDRIEGGDERLPSGFAQKIQHGAK